MILGRCHDNVPSCPKSHAKKCSGNGVGRGYLVAVTGPACELRGLHGCTGLTWRLLEGCLVHPVTDTYNPVIARFCHIPRNYHEVVPSHSHSISQNRLLWLLRDFFTVWTRRNWIKYLETFDDKGETTEKELSHLNTNYCVYIHYFPHFVLFFQSQFIVIHSSLLSRSEVRYITRLHSWMKRVWNRFANIPHTAFYLENNSGKTLTWKNTWKWQGSRWTQSHKF